MQEAISVLHSLCNASNCFLSIRTTDADKCNALINQIKTGGEENASSQTFSSS